MAIEVTNGDVARFVKGYIQHLTSQNSGDFKTFNAPGPEDITAAIAVAEAEILTWLAGAGYGTDTTLYSTLAKDYLSWYNAIGAAYRLEMYHPGLQFATGANTRFDRLHLILLELKDLIEHGGLAGLDLPIDTSGTLKGRFTAGSVTDKQTQEADTDKVQPFFHRRVFRHPGVSESQRVSDTTTQKL